MIVKVPDDSQGEAERLLGVNWTGRPIYTGEVGTSTIV
jgi:hypothetical protein